MRGTIRTADEPTIRLLDGLVIFWVVLWFLIGAWTGVTIWAASDIGDTITTSGHALESTGTALTKLGAVPVVGERAKALGEEVQNTATDIASRGQEFKGQLHRLSLMLGISIMVMPTTPIVGLYLPLRLARRREVVGIRRTLAKHGDDPQLDRYLAERALSHLPFTAIYSVSTDPWRDLSDGRARDLADVELGRLGLERPGT